jgi:hypothetical protein
MSTIPTNATVDVRNISATPAGHFTGLATELVAARTAFNQGLVEQVIVKLNELANLARALHL